MMIGGGETADMTCALVVKQWLPCVYYYYYFFFTTKAKRIVSQENDNGDV